MEWIADPTAWLGLLTLIVLELVLGIDNLVFIAILADKLPPEQRDRARVIGLTLALLMRLGLLASISWTRCGLAMAHSRGWPVSSSCSGGTLGLLRGSVNMALYKPSLSPK